MSKEIDRYLCDVFVRIKKQLVEYNDYIKEDQTPEYREISEDYLQDIAHIERLQPKLRGIAALCRMEEDDIDFVYQCLAMYESTFVFSAGPASQIEKEEEEYGKLSYILEMFSFDEDEDEEDSPDGE